MESSSTKEQHSSTTHPLKITLIGTGTIGLSFAAFHLSHLPDPANLTIYDTRPDIDTHIATQLPRYLAAEEHADPAALVSRIRVASSLRDAVANASIVQESGPENAGFKQELWRDVERAAPADALLWSSTSGIPASAQTALMRDRSRVVVVHPYNPPHLMPLIELVPAPETSAAVLRATHAFWAARGRVPVHLKRETTGFVANRLAFALLREAVHLVDQGVVTVGELDGIVESSMGPRWAVAGPFKSYHAGGGPGGLEAFFANIGGTVQSCWDDAGRVNVGDGTGWEDKIFQQAKETYGVVDTAERDRITRRVLQVLKEEKAKSRSASSSSPPKPHM